MSSLQSDYHENAKFWLREKPTIQSDFLCRPHVFELLGDLKGKSVVDIGCGDGYVSRYVATHGAFKTIGIDVKESVVQEAKKLEEKEKLGIEYYVGSATKLSMVDDKSMDLALSILVYVHFNSEEMDEATKEAARVLKPNGVFLLAVPHPLIYIAKPKTHWVTFTDEQKVNYFKDKVAHLILHRPDEGKTEIQAIPVATHTLSEYFNNLLENNFIIEKILEPEPTQQDLATYLHMWGEETSLPIYLIIKARKHA
ncbi:MAG TPA: class I SAM-dependent methyltransferase [Candidatus Saccharimonadales bacterium]|nr:class I SAM-dependent methyltransferase [Candidatus Saccharimonadales bacterium]